MATYYRMFDIGRQFFDANGDPANGQQLFVYAAGTTTKATVYKDNAGAASHTNPIVLESDGTIPDEEVWAPTGTYKFVLAPSDDTDPPASGLTLHDNVKPINDTGADSVSEWVASGLTPTRVDGTSFTVVGDQTTTLHVGRRLRITDSGTVYGTIIDSSYSAPDTTITVELDSGTIDSSLSAFDYSIVSFVNPSVEYPPVQFTGTALCPHQGLIIQQITTSTVDVDADNLVLTHETTSQQRTFASINLTADITASGANGLDTGSEASSTWYHIWVIAQPDGTTASLLSTSATAPTMPSGYVFKGYVGAIRNDASSDFLNFQQLNDYAAMWGDSGTTDMRVVSSAALGVYYAISYANQAPSTAKVVLAQVGALNAVCQIDLGVTLPPGSSTTDFAFWGLVRHNSASNSTWSERELPQLVTGTFYYRLTGTGATAEIWVTGWKF
jgi:hypothetical protein